MNKIFKVGVSSLTGVLAGFYVLAVLLGAVMGAAFSTKDQGLVFWLTLVIGLMPLLAVMYFIQRGSKPIRAPAFIQNNQTKVFWGAIATYGLLALLFYLAGAMK